MPAARTIAALLSACVALAWSTAAHAEDEPASRRFVLDYETHEPGTSDPCPDRSAFVASVRARTPRSQLAEGVEQESSAIRFRVIIDVGAAGTTGQLEVHEPDGGEQKRSVRSRTCREVAKALALVVALVLDPDASTSEPPPVEPPHEPPPPPPAPPPPPPARPRRPPPPPPRPLRTTPAWHASAGGELGATGGIGPDIAPVAGAFVDLSLHTTSLLAPSFRLGLDVAATGNDLPVGSQSYVWIAATARVCPLHVVLPLRLRLGPCAGLQVGLHRGTTTDVVNPTAHSDLWLAPTAGGSLELAATTKITVELQGGALFPLRRTRFFLAPNTTIYDVPPAAGTLAVSARVRFR